jgi:succinate dehydrogenase / fumarate reductase cytochrome b subunit
MALLSYLKSTLLSKVVMAVSGVFLILFLIVHTIGNMLIYLGQDAYNAYSHLLEEASEVLWLIRIVLILSIILHIITSIKLKFYNLNSKPQKYAVRNYVKAKLTSRTMIWTGIVIGCFVTYHLLHLTFNVTNPSQTEQNEYYESSNLYGNIPEGIPLQKEMKEIKYHNKRYVLVEEGKVLGERDDVYKGVVLGFRNPLIALIYMIGVLIVGFHLNHAIQSCFQTLGLNNPRYFPRIISASTALSYIFVLCLGSIPIAVLSGFIGKGV